ncbi:hypothetical protein [Methanolobus sp. ZRKC5]|uniref:DUF7847 domain-containing protein n=1 Tax=unclassified Methanolobus TaxID=2629569 RepID=UPI00313BE2E7
MVEDIGTVISKGFGTWTKNLNICVPFILEMMTAIAFFIFSLIIFTLMFIVPVVSQQNIDPGSISPEEMLSMFSDVFSENMWLLIFVGIIIFLLYMLVQSFFAAGAIGMARAASEKGNTNLGDMFNAGRENFLNLFLVNILVSLLAIAGLVFLVPGIISLGDISIFLANPDSAVAGVTILTIGMLAWVLYIISLSLIFFLVDYALVIDGLDPIGAIEHGISVFRNNIFSVFLMWLWVVGITVALTLVGEATSYVDVVAQLWSFAEIILSTIVIQPLIVVWLTRFYLNRTEKKLYSFEDYMMDY